MATPAATPAAKPTVTPAAGCRGGDEGEGAIIDGYDDTVAVDESDGDGDADADADADEKTQAVPFRPGTCPGAHGTQTAAPAATAANSGGHGAHASALEDPENGFAVPGAHGTQLKVPSLKVPAGHGGPQAADPAGVNVPLGQGEHKELPEVAAVPPRHIAIGHAAPPAHANPGWHGEKL
jgi:hypothetical protein